MPKFVLVPEIKNRPPPYSEQKVPQNTIQNEPTAFQFLLLLRSQNTRYRALGAHTASLICVQHESTVKNTTPAPTYQKSWFNKEKCMVIEISVRPQKAQTSSMFLHIFTVFTARPCFKSLDMLTWSILGSNQRLNLSLCWANTQKVPILASKGTLILVILPPNTVEIFYFSLQ